MPKSLSYLLFFSLLNVLSLLAQPSVKAQKYLKILVKKPQADHLFEKFYYTWLENDDSENLEKYLLAKKAEHPSYQQLLAHFYFYEHEESKALEIYNELIKTKPLPELLYRTAQIEKKNLNHQKAIAQLSQALKLKCREKLELKIRKNLALLLFRNEKASEALKVLKVILDKGDENLQEEIVDLLIKEGQFEQAKTLIVKKLKTVKSPYQKVRLQLRLGDLEFQTDKKEEAIAHYKNTLNSVGADSWLTREIYNQIEYIFKSDDNINGLSDFYTALRKTRKNDTELIKRNISVFKSLADEKNCLLETEALLKATPDNKENQILHLETLSQFKHYKKAQNFNEELIKAYPKDLQLLIRLTFLLHKNKLDQQIPAVLEKYQKNSPDPQFAILESVDLLKSYKLFSQAESLLEKQKLSELPAIFNFTLVSIKETLDKKDEAIEILKSIAQKSDALAFLKALKALKQHKETEAYTEILTKRISEFKDSFDLQYEYYHYLMHSKKYSEALKSSQAILKLALSDSQTSQATQDFLNCLKKNEKTSASLQSLFTTTEQKTPLFMLIKSQVLSFEKSPDEALKYIETTDLKDKSLQSEKLRLLDMKQDYKTMIDYLENTLLKQDRNKFPHYQKLVELNMILNETSTALKLLEDWKKFSPGSTIPYTVEADIHQQNQDRPNAIKSLKKANLRFPDNEEIAQKLAQFFQWNNDYHEAAKVFWRLIAKQNKLNKKIELIRSLIQIARNQNQLPTLRNELISRHDNNPKSLFPVIALANIEKELYNYSARRDYLIKALKIKNDDITLLSEIAKLDEEEGQIDRAKEMYIKIAKLDKSSNARAQLINFYIRNELDNENFDLKRETAKLKFSDKEIINIANTLFITDFVKMRDFLASQKEHFPDNYQIAYLHALSLVLNEQKQEATNAFLAVSRMNKELSIIPNAQQQQQQQNSFAYKQYYKQFSKEFVIYLKFSRHKHTVFQYQNYLRNLSHYSGNRQQRQQQFFNLPINLNQLKDYCLHHIIRLYTDAKDDQKAELLSQIKSFQIPNIEFHLEFEAVGQDYNIQREFIHKKFIEDPNNTFVQELWIQRAGDKEFKELGEEKTLKILKGFKARNELTYLNFIARALKAKALPKEPYFKEVLSLIEKQDLKKQKSLFNLYYLLDHRPTKETLDHSVILKSALIAYQNNLENFQGLQRLQALQSLLMTAFRHESYQVALQLLDEELLAIKNDPKISKSYQNTFHNYRYQGRHQQQQAFISDYQATPSNSIIPSYFLAFFYPVQNHYNQVKINKKKLADKAPKLKSLALQAIVFELTGQEEKAIASLNQFIKENPSKDALLFAAKLSQQQKNIEQTIAYLSQAQKLTKGKEQTKIATSIIFHATASQKKEDKILALDECKKLLQTNLNTAEKGELATYFERLGDQKSADKIDQDLKAALSKPRRQNSTRHSNNRRHETPIQKLEKALRRNPEGKEKTQVLNRSLRHIQNYARNVFRDKRLNNQHQYENLIRNISNKNLTEETITLLMKDRELTAPLLCAKALLYEFSNKSIDKKKAIPVYQEALKHSNAKSIHLRLSLLLFKDNQETALKHLKLGLRDSLANFFNVINNNYDLTRDLETLLVLEKFITEKLLSTDKKKLQRINVHNFLYKFTGSTRYNNDSLPGIFDRNFIKRMNENDFQKKAHKRRVQAYKKIVEAYARTPDTAYNIFTQVSLNSQVPFMNLDDTVKNMALLILKSKKFQHHGGSSSNGQYSSQTPFMTLLLNAHDKEKLSVVKEFFSDKKHADFITESLLDILLSSKEQVIAKLTALSEHKTLTENMIFPNLQQGKNSSVIIQWFLKSPRAQEHLLQLTPLIKTQIEAQFKRNEEEQHQQFELSFFYSWSQALPKDNTEAFALNNLILTRVNKIISKELKDNKATTFREIQNINNNYKYSQIVRELLEARLRARDPKLLPLLQAFSKLKALNEESFIQSSSIQYELQRYNREVIEKFELFSQSNMFKDLPEFSLIKDDSQNYSTFKKIRQRSYQSKIQKITKQTFGTRLLLALYENQPAQAMLKLLNKEITALQAFEQKERLYQEIHQFLSEENATAELKKFPKLKEEFQSFIQKDFDQKLKQLYAYDLYKNHNEWQFLQDSAKIISSLLVDDPKKAASIFKSVSRKVRSYRLRRNNNNSRSASEDLIERLRSQASNNFQKLSFCFKLLPFVTFKDPNSRTEHYLQNSFFSSIQNELSAEMKRLKKAKVKNSGYQAFLKIYPQLPKQFDYKSKPAFRCFRYPFQRMNTEELKSIIEYLKKQDPKNVLHQDTLYLAQLKRQEKGNRSKRQDFDQSFVDYFIKRASDFDSQVLAETINNLSINRKKMTKAQAFALLEIFNASKTQGNRRDERFRKISSLFSGINKRQESFQTDAEIKVIKETLKVWIKSFKNYNINRPDNYLSDRLSLLQTILRTKEPELIKTVLEEKAIELKLYPETYLLLLQNDLDQIYTETFLKNYQAISFEWGRQNSTLNRSKLQKKFNSFTLLSDKKELQLLSKALIAYGSQSSQQQKEVGIDFTKSTIKDKKIEDTLFHIILSGNSHSSISKLYPKYFNEKNIQKVIDSSRRTLFPALADYIASATILEKDFKQTWEKVSSKAIGNRNNYNGWRLADEITKKLVSKFTTGSHQTIRASRFRYLTTKFASLNKSNNRRRDCNKIYWRISLCNYILGSDEKLAQPQKIDNNLKYAFNDVIRYVNQLPKDKVAQWLQLPAVKDLIFKAGGNSYWQNAVKKYKVDLLASFHTFSKSPMFKEAKDFALIPKFHERSSLLIEIQKKNYKEQIQAIKPSTFGTKLLLTLYEKDSVTALLSFLEKNIDTLPILQEKDKLYREFKFFLTETKSTKKLEKFPVLEKALKQFHQKDIDRKVNELYSYDLDKNNNEYQLFMNTAELIFTLDIEQASNVFKTVSDKVRSHRLTRSSNYSRSPSEDLIERLRQQSSNDFQKLSYCFKFLPLVTFKDPNNRTEDYLQKSFFYSIRKELLNEINHLKKTIVKGYGYQAFLKIYSQLPKQFNYKNKPAFYSFRYPFQKMQKADLKAIIDDLKKQDKTELQQDILHLAQLKKQEKESNSKRQNFDKHFVEYFIKRAPNFNAPALFKAVNELYITNKKMSKEQSLTLLKIFNSKQVKANRRDERFMNISRLFAGMNQRKEAFQTAEEIKLLKETTKIWISAFHSYKITQPNRYIDDRLSFLQAVVKTKNIELSKTLLKEKALDFKLYPETYLLLLQNDFDQVYTETFLKNYQSISFEWGRHSSPLNTSKLSKKFTSFKLDSPNKELKLFSRALISYGSYNRDQQKEVGTEFAKSTIKDKKIEDTLFHIVLSGNSYSSISKLYPKYFNEKNIQKVIDSSRRTLFPALIDYISSATVSEQTFKQTWEKASSKAIGNSYNYNGWRLADEITRKLVSNFNQKSYLSIRASRFRYLTTNFDRLNNSNNRRRDCGKIYWRISLCNYILGSDAKLAQAKKIDSNLKYADNDVIRYFNHLPKDKVALWLQLPEVKDLILKAGGKSYWENASNTYKVKPLDSFQSFQKSPIFKEAKDFALIPIDKNKSLFIEIQKKNYQAQIQAIKTPTFGTKLLLTLYEKDSVTALLSFLEKNIEELNKVKDKTKLFEEIKLFLGSHKRTKDLSTYPKLQLEINPQTPPKQTGHES